jgi:uncharacterized integral membrane protein (TIGR00698 family)
VKTQQTRLPGIALAAVIAVIAWAIQQAEVRLIGHAVIEGLVIAILLGMLYRNTRGVPKALTPGVAFTGKEILEFAVLLLGASISFPDLFKQGYGLLLAIVILVAVALTASSLAGRALGLNPKLATLVAVGNSICGNSAIAAVAPVIKAEPDDVAASIAFTAVLGVVVVLTLPLLIPLLAYSNYQYGVLAGMSVYAVPQVVAAAAQVSDVSLKVATSVKLVRVLLMGPVVLFFALRHRDAKVKFSLNKFVPWFIAGFLLLAALRSVGVIPTAVGDQLAQIGKYITIAAMAALGLSVDIRSIQKAGPRVSAAVVISLLVLIATSTVLIAAFGLSG